MLRVGLTGGIASGKSMVARFLSELGAPVVDADQLSRDVTRPGCPLLSKIVDIFGVGVIDRQGRLDRKKLADRVFSERSARKKLESITHPAIMAAAEERFSAYAEKGVPYAVFEAALLVETGLVGVCDVLIVVAAGKSIQMDRIRKRDGLSLDEAQARINAQMPLDQKVKKADHVIWNEDDLDTLRAHVVGIHSQLLSRAKGK